MGDLQRTGGAPRRGAVHVFRMPRRPALATGAPLLPAAGGRKKEKRKKMAVARLGGGGRRSIFGAVRRLRMRWMAAVYRRALRRLRAFYARALEDLLEGAACVSTLRAQAGADCSFGTAFAPAVSVVPARGARLCVRVERQEIDQSMYGTRV